MNRLSKRSALLAALALAASACSTPEQVEEELSIDAAAAELTVNHAPRPRWSSTRTTSRT